MSTETKANGQRLARLPLGRMFERTDKFGRRYLSGRLGNAKLMAFESGEESRGEPIWELVLVQGPNTPDGAIALANGIDAEAQ